LEEISDLKPQSSTTIHFDVLWRHMVTFLTGT
jgi:hypothetical protein